MADGEAHVDASRQQIRARFARYSTSLVADVLGDLGRPDQVVSPSVRPTTRTPGTTVGWAYTVVGRTEPDVAGPDLVKARAIDAMPAGCFAVWVGGDVEDVCLFGDLLATGQHARGVVGAIVDGGVRDSETIQRLGFPVWARYTTPRASTGTWRVTSVEVPVELPGTLGGRVHVASGDLVVADLDGSVVVPAGTVDQVGQRCDALSGRESAIRTRVESGESIERLLQEHGRI